MTVGIEDIRTAAQAIEGEVVRTPLVAAPRLSQTLGCEISLKLENLQFTGSFKDRGALNKLKSLSAAEAGRGVIAMSAGNHAQGVAHHAQRLGIPATIVMPEFAPFTKVERTRSFGARVVLEGDTIDAAAEAARRIQQEEGLAFIHPYDDPMIVAGQGSIGLEMLADRPDLELIVVPIGGGGIISGIALAAKAVNPEIRILGVEAELYPSMYQALNDLSPSAGGTTLADGIAVKTPGGLTKAIVADLVDEILLVDEPGFEAAVQLLVEEQKLVAEGAGAAGIAAILKYPERFAGRRVATVICGGNIDVRLLASVLTRGLIRDGRLVKLRVEIVDRPGMLARISECIGRTGGNIIEVHHQRMFSDVPAKQADLDIMVETRNPAHVDEIVTLLEGQGLPTRIISSRSIDPGS